MSMNALTPQVAGSPATRRVLVVYYSRSGATARVARDLASQLGADIEVLHDTLATGGPIGYLRALFAALREQPSHLEPLQHDPADYALVVIGTPVWAWRPTPAIRAYLVRQRGRLPTVGFFVTSGDTDVDRIVPSLEALYGHRAVASAGFNAHELADAATYEPKLRSFAGLLQAAMTRSVPGARRSVEFAVS